jgi:hypothetical protein
MDRPPVHELSAVNCHSLRFKCRATTLTLNFDEVYSEIQWTGKKGANPEGIKTWFLPEGIYKARFCASQSQKEPDWKLFAVVDGKEEPLTETEVFHIFQDEGPKADGEPQ